MKTQKIRHMVRFTLLAVLVILTGMSVSAQQDPHYSMYMFNSLAFNPAVAGSHDDISTTLLYRKQWVNFPGSPSTGTCNIHSPLRNDKVGIGASFVNDKIGSFRQNSLALAYAYHLKLRKVRLSMGLQAVGANFSIDLADLKTNPSGLTDNSFSQNSSVFNVNFGTGAYLYNRNFWFGVSMPHILNAGIEKKMTADDNRATQAAHFYAMGGFVTKINPVVSLRPSFLIKQVKGAPVQADINAMIYFYKLVGIGLSYRTQDAIAFMTELNISQNFRLAYAYDQTTSTLNSYHLGSHEIILQHHFGFSKKRITSPRLF